MMNSALRLIASFARVVGFMNITEIRNRKVKPSNALNSRSTKDQPPVTCRNPRRRTTQTIVNRRSWPGDVDLGEFDDLRHQAVHRAVEQSVLEAQQDAGPRPVSVVYRAIRIPSLILVSSCCSA